MELVGITVGQIVNLFFFSLTLNFLLFDSKIGKSCRNFIFSFLFKYFTNEVIFFLLK